MTLHDKNGLLIKNERKDELDDFKNVFGLLIQNDRTEKLDE